MHVPVNGVLERDGSEGVTRKRHSSGTDAIDSWSVTHEAKTIASNLIFRVMPFASSFVSDPPESKRRAEAWDPGYQ